MLTEIKFNRTSNIFLNSGIIGLDYYLQEFKIKTNLEYQHELGESHLEIYSNQMYKLLEDVYYYMGNQVYNTATLQQKDENLNAYFDENKDEFIRFPKMNTYGLSHLITNNAQGVTRSDKNSINKKQLAKKNPELLLKIENYFKENNLTLLQKIYLNEPYTKISRLEPLPEDKYFEQGENTCYLTGEQYKALVPVTNSSPFFSGGILNFNSMLNLADKKISWISLYLCRFAPVIALYSYEGRQRNIIMCYFLQSNNLINQKKIYSDANIFKNKIEIEKDEYLSNFDLYNFASEKNSYHDYTEKYEFLFMIIYTIYKKRIEEYNVDLTSLSNSYNFLKAVNLEKLPIGLVAFKSNKFASTMRTDSYEEINNFKFILSLFAYLEKNEISIKDFLSSLKFIKPSLKKKENSYRLERQLRNKVLKNIITNKNILPLMESLFYDCFRFKIAGEKIGYKNYKNLLLFTQYYEIAIKFGGQNKMDENLQEKAINLGKSIGQGVLNFDFPKTDNEKRYNAKMGRGYLISLKKCRTLDQFLESLIRIQTKFNISISNDILKQLSKQNYIYIKQFAIISALNQINPILK